MNERDTNFFRPLWRRVLVTAVVAVWFGAELILSRDPFWSVLSGLALAYAIWNFFLGFPRDDSGAGPKP